jgi:branched-chain amino acid transport system substrate-binding protein
MIVEQINQAGGINGKTLKLIVYDDEGDPTKCNLHVKKLLEQDKVTAVIGPSISGLSLAVVQVFEQNQTPLISCAASYKIVHNDETGKPYPWIFKTPQLKPPRI